MLRAAPKGQACGGLSIGPGEDEALRAAFGRYGGSAAARALGAEVVARYQQHGTGCWFLCDCRPGDGYLPVLVPVQQTHIRRHEHPPWPVHFETCDFYRDPEEQRAITASYTRLAANRPMRLALPLGRVAAEAPRTRMEAASRHTSRPGIARLLIQLTTDAGLQRLGPGWQPLPLVDQMRAIWTAAGAIEIDSGVRLTDFLCTSPGRLGQLKARIDAVSSSTFSRTRPHGVLLVRLAAIGNGVLHPVAGDPIPIRGRLAVFGERVGLTRETGAQRAARAPYLAACVVGRAEEGGEVEVLSAYAHPIASDNQLMLLDSDLERRSLAQLRSVQVWLGHKKDVRVTIEKPMYDLLGDHQGGDVVARPPCIPDFIVTATGPGGDVRVVVAETMGFADADYRGRKQRMHPVMMAAAGAAALASHDFHEPDHQTQEWRDKRFWREVRWALTGPDPAVAMPLREG